jgi:hypothetical protein
MYKKLIIFTVIYELTITTFDSNFNYITLYCFEDEEVRGDNSYKEDKRFQVYTCLFLEASILVFFFFFL